MIRSAVSGLSLAMDTPAATATDVEIDVRALFSALVEKAAVYHCLRC